MFLAQARLTPGFHVAVVADLNVEKALQALTTTGWAKEQFAARGLDDALTSGATWVTDDAGAIFNTEAIAVVIDATSHPPAGIHHARLAPRHGKHIVLVNDEADAWAGPLLAERDADAGPVSHLPQGHPTHRQRAAA